MGWLLAIIVLLLLLALPVTLAAVAVRPSRVTIRTAAMSLLAFVGVVTAIVLIGVLA